MNWDYSLIYPTAAAAARTAVIVSLKVELLAFAVSVLLSVNVMLKLSTSTAELCAIVPIIPDMVDGAKTVFPVATFTEESFPVIQTRS